MVDYKTFFDGIIENSAGLSFIANAYIGCMHGIFDADRIKGIFKGVFDASAATLTYDDKGYRQYLKNVENEFEKITKKSPVEILQNGVNISRGDNCNVDFFIHVMRNIDGKTIVDTPTPDAAMKNPNAIEGSLDLYKAYKVDPAKIKWLWIAPFIDIQLSLSIDDFFRLNDTAVLQKLRDLLGLFDKTNGKNGCFWRIFLLSANDVDGWFGKIERPLFFHAGYKAERFFQNSMKRERFGELCKISCGDEIGCERLHCGYGQTFNLDRSVSHHGVRELYCTYPKRTFDRLYEETQHFVCHSVETLPCSTDEEFISNLCGRSCGELKTELAAFFGNSTASK